MEQNKTRDTEIMSFAKVKKTNWATRPHICLTLYKFTPWYYWCSFTATWMFSEFINTYSAYVLHVLICTIKIYMEGYFLCLVCLFTESTFKRPIFFPLGPVYSLHLWWFLQFLPHELYFLPVFPLSDTTNHPSVKIFFPHQALLYIPCVFIPWCQSRME